MSDVPAPARLDDLLRHAAWVAALCRRLVQDETAAEDLEQSVWLAAARTPPAVGASERGWLTTVARNLARTMRRRATRVAYRERRGARPEAVASTADVVARVEIQRRVVRAVMDLDEPYRTTVLLRFFEDLPPRDVASRLGVPVETVRTRTRRALERLRSRLDEDFGDRRQWVLAVLPLLDLDPRGAPVTAGAATTLVGVTMAVITANKLTLVGALALLVVGGILWSGPAGNVSDEAETTAISPSDLTDPPGKPPPRRRGRPRTENGESSPAAAAAAETPATTETVRIEVQLPGGALVPRARVLVDGAEIATSDASGGVTVPVADVDRAFSVSVQGWPVAITVLPAAARDHTVALAPGEAVSGVVRADGGEPGEAVSLVLKLDRGLPFGARVSSAFMERLRRERFSPEEVRTQCTPDGRFRFDGLPTRLGRLEASGGYVLASADDDGLQVRAPAGDVVLELRRLSWIRGRVVDPAGNPIHSALFRVEVLSRVAKGHLAESRSNGFAGSDGRFALTVRIDAAAIRLVVMDSRGAGERSIELEPKAPEDHVVGDVAIAAVDDLAFEIRDAHGEPIPGARVLAEAVLGIFSGPTDASGRTALRVGAGRASCAAGAVGYAVSRFEVATATSAPIAVTLERTTLISVRTPGRTDDMLVLVQVPRGAFGPDLDWMDPVHDGVSPGGMVSASGGMEDRFHVFLVPEDGLLSVSGLLPRTPVEFLLVDPMGHEHAYQKVTLAHAEWKDVTLAATPASHSLSIVVRDGAGKPIADADVVITAASKPRSTAGFSGMDEVEGATGADGRLVVDDVHAAAVWVLVRAHGHGPVVRRLRVSENREETFVLAPERTVRIEVLDEDGVHLPGAGVWADVPGMAVFDGRYWHGEPQDDGTYVIHGLPAGRVALVVTNDAGETRRIDHDANTAAARIVW